MAEVLPMPDVRRRRLKELEAIIASGWAEAVRVGQALREIRDEGLYLELGEGITFEDYCKSRWALAESTAYQYLDAAQVHEATSAIGGVPILNERVGRELAPLLRSGGPEKVAEAWSRVSERYRDQRPPTAREVHRVLVEEGYRPRVGEVSGGRTNTRILLGQFGDRLVTAEKRLEWFLARDMAGRKVSKPIAELARDYADRCEALATRLRSFAGEQA